MIIRWIPFLATAFAFGQEAVPFSPEKPDPWKPAWEATFRGDRLSYPEEPSESFRRASVQLRLRWTFDLDAFSLVAGTRSAMGSDSNRDNESRWDQQPSNGSQVDVAFARTSWATPRTFGTLKLGFQENGLVYSQALWDRDLRFLGAGGGVGFRDTEGLLQEAGFRAVVGRVRTILGGKIDLAAGQFVLRLDTGAFSWLAHVDHWDLGWEAGEERLRALPGHPVEERQRMKLDAVGGAATWHAAFPLEGRWFKARNPITGETSEEVQFLAGSRERTYWPEFAFIWQRLSSTGTLYPVNGDEWWFYRAAQGPRYDLSIPLPGNWVASFIYLQQTAEGDAYRVTRKMLVLAKRF